MTFDTIPQDLKAGAFWCLWKYEDRNGKRTKPPYNPHTLALGNSSDYKAFSDYETAYRAFSRGGFEGMGIGMFGGLCAVDIDHCMTGGELSPMAQDIIDTMQSYTEISPSGKGVRIIFLAEGFQYDKERFYINNAKAGLEVYISGCTNKYVTITGNALNTAPIRDCSKVITQVLEKYMLREQGTPTKPTEIAPPSDFLQRGLEKDTKLQDLWNGSRPTGDESADDLALMNKLAYWCNCDTAAMLAAFRSSPYHAQKDPAHIKKAQRKDYLQATAQKAAKGCNRTASADHEAFKAEQVQRDFGAGSKVTPKRTSIEGNRLSLALTKEALQEVGVTVRYNQLLKDYEVKDLPGCYSAENAVNLLPVYLMDYLKSCGCKGVTKEIVMDYLSCIADEFRFNPVQELLQSQPWDGVDRLPEIYRILGANLPKYQTYIKKWFLQCVALALNDEARPIGADGVLVLQGPQGLAKTSFFRIMTPFPKWFVEGAVVDTGNKDTLLKVLGGWISELGELESTLKKEQSSLKAFITSTEDRIRAPYARAATRSPRRTSLCGTVNPKDYLKDETGSRRFWTIPVTEIDKKALFTLSRKWVNQVWFQMYALYQQNKAGFRLTQEEMQLLQVDNQEFDIPLPYETEIRELLDLSLPVHEWEWWRAGQLKYLLYPFDAVKVGRALTRIVTGFNAEYDPRTTPVYPVKNPRENHRANEYFLPLKRGRVG